jgi:pimeloyl-ACP methyl ester carboxylesterase
MESARRLADHLNRRKDAAPDEPLVLVGHSHGGNVCRAAASFAQPGKVQGVIYIATPHLLFSKKRGRAAVYCLYAMPAAITMLVSTNILLIAAPAAAWLRAQIGGSAGFVFAYLGCLIFQAGLFMVLTRVLLPSQLRRRRPVRHLARSLLAFRRAAIRRNCFTPRRLPELSITTKSDEAYSYLRLMQAASWTYQLMIRAYFILTGAMFAVVGGMMAILAVVATVLIFLYVREPPTASDWPEVREQLTAMFSFTVGMPVLMAVMLLMMMWIYFLFYGGAWSYGMRLIFDLFFLRLAIARSLPGNETAVISIPFWKRLRQMTLLHFAIHRQPDTARAALDWARAKVHREALVR